MPAKNFMINKTVKIEDAGVDPAYRKQGIGKALLKEIVASYKSQNIANVRDLNL